MTGKRRRKSKGASTSNDSSESREAADAAPQQPDPSGEDNSSGKTRRRQSWRIFVALLALGVILIEAVIGVRWWLTQRHLSAAREALDIVQFEAALSELAAADRLAPDRADVHYWFAVTYRRSDRLDRFRAHLDRSRELGWESADLDRQETLAATQLGRFDEVQIELDALLQGDADDRASAEIFEAMAKGHMAVYRLREAWNCLSFWIDASPDSIPARMHRGDIYYRMGDNDAALEDFRKVIEYHPQHAHAHARVAEILMEKNRPDEARDHFETVLKLVPDDFAGLVGLAKCHQTSGEHREAKAILEGLLRRDLADPSRSTVLTELGRIAIFNNEDQEAIRLLTEALQLAPENGNIHHSLGTALARTGSEDRARYHIERGQEVAAENQRLHELTMDLVAEPADADGRTEVAEILLKQGFTNEAAAWLRTALQFDPDHLKAHQMLADICQQGLQIEQAQFHREQVRRLQAKQGSTDTSRYSTPRILRITKESVSIFVHGENC